MRRVINLFFIFSLSTNLVLGIPHKQHLYAQSTGVESAATISSLHIDFSKIGNDPDTELQSLGFSLEKAMKNNEKIHLSGTGDMLEINALKPAFGLMVNKHINITASDTVIIEWGVNSYPEGADWGNELNRDAIMVYLFFGDPVDADHFYLPDSPYFIGMFLGEKERQQVPYIGKNYKDTGRFVCLGRPEQGKMIRSTFNFRQAYLEWFATSDIPPVTGIAIEVDTTDLPAGTSSAFIKTISLTTAE